MSKHEESVKELSNQVIEILGKKLGPLQNLCLEREREQKNFDILKLEFAKSENSVKSSEFIQLSLKSDISDLKKESELLLCQISKLEEKIKPLVEKAERLKSTTDNLSNQRYLKVSEPSVKVEKPSNKKNDLIQVENLATKEKKKFINL